MTSCDLAWHDTSNNVLCIIWRRYECFMHIGSDFTPNMLVWIVSPLTVMVSIGDLRSWPVKDIAKTETYVAHIGKLIWTWKFEHICSKTLAVVRGQTFFHDLNLGWPGDLTWGQINFKFSEMLRKSLLGKVRKFELPSSKRLGEITKKPQGGAPEAPSRQE